MADDANQNIAVSIIIPIYNAETYLRECLDSAVSQTYRDIEIICVNDGSTDGTLEILNEYADNDSRVIVISKANEGQSVARNTGIEAARGKYLYYCDSDDFVSPDLVETCVGKMDEHSLDVIYFDAETVFENAHMGDKFAKYDNYYVRKANYEGVLAGVAFYTESHENADYKVQVCIQMIRRDFLIESGISFYPGIVHQDNLYTFQTMLSARRVMHIHDRFYYRRIRENSVITSLDKGEKDVRPYFIVVREMLKFLDEKFYDESTVAMIKLEISRYVGKIARDSDTYMSPEQINYLFREDDCLSQILFSLFVENDLIISKKFKKLQRYLIKLSQSRAYKLYGKLSSAIRRRSH